MLESYQKDIEEEIKVAWDASKFYTSKIAVNLNIPFVIYAEHGRGMVD